MMVDTHSVFDTMVMIMVGRFGAGRVLSCDLGCGIGVEGWQWRLLGVFV
jgi:hypothetical protein